MSVTTIESLQEQFDEGIERPEAISLCNELLESDDLDDEQERKQITLLLFLLKNGNDYTPDDIVETSYDDCLFEVNPHRVYRGTSPKEAKSRCELVRKALQIVVDSLPKAEPAALRVRDRISTRIFVHRDANETVSEDGQRMLSHDVSTWTVKDLADAETLAHRIKHGQITEDHLCSLGINTVDHPHQTDHIPPAFIPTYSTCVALFRELCPDLVSQGIHDLVNSLYFLSPGTDDYDQAKDHRDTLREAFDGGPITDRRTKEHTNDGEYLVCTDEEADQKQDDCFESMLDDGGCVEGADSPYFNREKWKRDAKIDGRGHTIACYDGCENQCDEYFIYRMN